MAESAVAAGVLAAVSAVEDEVDAEIQRLENLDEEGLGRLREERLQQLKREAKQVYRLIVHLSLENCYHGTQREEWKAQGHGVYSEIVEEKEFFEVCKKSTKVVCHFFRESTWRCKIVDKHLHLLAPRHLETRLITPLLMEGNNYTLFNRFVKLSVERAPFLCERLKIHMLPTIGLVVDGKTKDFIKGLLLWNCVVLDVWLLL